MELVIVIGNKKKAVLEIFLLFFLFLWLAVSSITIYQGDWLRVNQVEQNAQKMIYETTQALKIAEKSTQIAKEWQKFALAVALDAKKQSKPPLPDLPEKKVKKGI